MSENIEKKTVKTIGVLTSGGDAPGMNAASRAVVRSGIANGLPSDGNSQGIRGPYQRGDF